jgi:hypothetical protein
MTSKMTSDPHTTREADTSSRARRPANHGPLGGVSRLTAPVLAAAFLFGVAQGAVAYVHRSAVAERHTAGTNAITIHVILAIAAAAVVIAVQVWRVRQPGRRGPSPWGAPFAARAMAKLRLFYQRSPGAAMARGLPAALLILVILYCPYRMGAQVIGGLDPNATVNAWGGPSYAGALLAHWLDCVIGFYAAALLLSRLPADRRRSRPRLP